MGFDDYIQGITNHDIQEKVQAIISFIENTYPELETKIAWNHPHFIKQGTFIFALSYAKGHVALAPEAVTVNKFKEEAKEKGYQVTKQLIKIKDKQTINFDLIKKMIDFNIEDKNGYKKYWRE